MDRHQTILVVDDADEIREAYVDLLEARGFSVVSAATGEDGVACALRVVPDLAIMDVVLPGMDGFEAISSIREKLGHRAPPVVVCSGFDITEAEARRRGATMFLPKPVDAESLLFAVELVLEGARPMPLLERDARRTASARRRTAHALARGAAAAITPSRITAHADVALRWLRRYLDCSFAGLFLVDEQDVRRVTFSGQAPDVDGRERGTFRDQFRVVAETRSSLVVPDVTVHPCFRPPSHDGHSVRFVVAVPVSVNNASTVVGVLALSDARPRRFEAEDLAIVEEFGRRSSLLLGVDEERAVSAGISEDAEVLTGRTFQRLLALELRLAHRMARPLQLTLVQVDPITEVDVVAREVVAAVHWPRAAVGRVAPERLGLFVRGVAGQTQLPDVAGTLSDTLGRFPHTSIIVTAGPGLVTGADGLMDGAEEILASARQSTIRRGGTRVFIESRPSGDGRRDQPR
jgi:DNA-binding response OmpR family regulator